MSGDGSEAAGDTARLTTVDEAAAQESADVSAQSLMPERPRRFMSSVYSRNTWAVVARGLRAARSTTFVIILSGFAEPVLYLVAMGIGVGSLIGSVEYNNSPVSYAAYIAPALLATSAMNGAVYDSTWNVFHKIKFSRLYSGMLATPLGPFDVALGEIVLALIRGLVYSMGFMAIMGMLGIVTTWTALLAIPAALLVAFGFAALGMAITAYLNSYAQMEWINIALLPMFLLSATFFPITVYPEALQWVIMAFPLWHAVELVRQLMLGAIDWQVLMHVGYFIAMIAIGLALVTRRLQRLFLR